MLRVRCALQLFTISVPAEREAEARALVAGMAPGAQLTYSVGGTLKYELPTEQVSHISRKEGRAGGVDG